MKTLFTLLFTISIITAYCQPDFLDQSFGNKGFVKTMVADSVNLFGVGTAAALQQDGKIVVSGGFSTNKPQLIRYMPDGSIDRSFGSNGITTINAFTETFNDHYSFLTGSTDGTIKAIAIQPDGRIVVAGTKDITGVFAARFMPNGTLDATFGNNGVTVIGVNLHYYGVSAMTLQPDGKLLIAGGKSCDIDYTPFDCGIIIRFNADGSIDKSFAKDGIVVNENSWMPDYVGAYNYNAIAVQPDGKIVATGYQYGGGFTTINFVVSRYNTDGTPDTTFGNGGTVITNWNDWDDSPESIAILPDGKILIGGYSSAKGYTYTMTALRYTADGKLDVAFGNKGQATVSFKQRIARPCMALRQPNGKIIMTGSVYTRKQRKEVNVILNEKEFALCRINEDGSIDSSFGIDGRQVIVSEDANESFHTALLQPDGRIVLVAESWYNENLTAVLTRYNGGGIQQPLIASLKQHEQNISINWQGLDNKNISYYSIQCSQTKNGFTEKGKVSAEGSSRLREYSYHIAAAGFYRVVAVDKDGHKTFSNKLLVNGADLTTAATIYPNPVQDYLTVQDLNSAEQLTISIVNGSGAVLATGVSRGSTQYRISTAGLPSGTYYLNITGERKTTTLPFVKE